MKSQWPKLGPNLSLGRYFGQDNETLIKKREHLARERQLEYQRFLETKQNQNATRHAVRERSPSALQPETNFNQQNSYYNQQHSSYQSTNYLPQTNQSSTSTQSNPFGNTNTYEHKHYDNPLRNSIESSLSQTYGFSDRHSNHNPNANTQPSKQNPSTPPFPNHPVHTSPPLLRTSSSASSNGYSPNHDAHSPSRNDGHFFDGIGKTEHVQPRKAFMGAIATMNTTEEQLRKEKEKRDQYARELAAQVEEARQRKEREKQLRNQKELEDEKKALAALQQNQEQHRRTDPNSQPIRKQDDTQLRYELDLQIQEKNRRIAEEKRKEKEYEKALEEKIRKEREAENAGEKFIVHKPALSRTNSTRASLEISRTSSEEPILEPPKPREPEPEPQKLPPAVQMVQPTFTTPYPIIMPYAPPMPTVSAESIATTAVFADQLKQLIQDLKKDSQKEKEAAEQTLKQKESHEQFQLLLSKLQQTEHELSEMKKKFEAQEKEKFSQQAQKELPKKSKPTLPTWSEYEPPVSRRMNRSVSTTQLEDDTMKSLKAESTFIYVTKDKNKVETEPVVQRPVRSALREPELQKQMAPLRDLESQRQLSAPPTAKRPQSDTQQEPPTRDWSALFANKGVRSPRDADKLFKKTDQRLKMLEDLEKKLSHSNTNDTLSDLLSQFVDNGKMKPLTSATNGTPSRPGTSALQVPFSTRLTTHDDSFGSPSQVDKSLISESSFIPLRG